MSSLTAQLFLINESHYLQLFTIILQLFIHSSYLYIIVIYTW